MSILGNEPIRTSRKTPLWKGPCVDGVTVSLLMKFYNCPERFRLLTIEGLRPKHEFHHRIEFGNMWHICEEAHAKKLNWEQTLQDYTKKLITKYRHQQGEIDKWYSICNLMYPIYGRHWNRDRSSLHSEKVFEVNYRLPNGITVVLRGKYDGIDEVENDKVDLFETKTKGDIPQEEAITRQLRCDLQTMFYLVAMQQQADELGFSPKSINGVLYNVIKRPKQYQGKKETTTQFYERLEGIIQENPNDFFARWKVKVSQEDIKRFKEYILDPKLMQLYEWYNWITGTKKESRFKDALGIHYMHPYGVYNALDEGRDTAYDDYLDSGDDRKLESTETLFPELS